ncbi:hypothetical protein RJ639_013794 [Escallonia herrerae]|uniref:Mediator of RNA polymerase II transcription subunit 25 n=1 Tax=Escallonia herrerae TaxID=1293975 RepID=A0AA89AN73_9ASTE|nr:hypothetical protein RJ639_013794 [Escallonia herrerae]
MKEYQDAEANTYPLVLIFSILDDGIEWAGDIQEEEPNVEDEQTLANDGDMLDDEDVELYVIGRSKVWLSQQKYIEMDPFGGKPVLGLVMYGANEPHSACLVQPSGWTRDMDIFLQWLSMLSFSGGGFDESAVAEGLSNALMMFPLNLNGGNAHRLGKWHCILVAASSPYPLPRPVLLPVIKTSSSGQISEARIECFEASIDMVTQAFSQGYNTHQAAESTMYDILLSRDFLEACDALNQNAAQTKSTFETEVDMIPPFAENFSDHGIAIMQEESREPAHVLREGDATTVTVPQQKVTEYRDEGDNITMLQGKLSEPALHTPQKSGKYVHNADRKMEISARMSKEARPTGPRCLYVPDGSYKRDSSSGTHLGSLVSQENIGFDDLKVHLTPTGIVLSQDIHPTANTGLYSNLTTDSPYQVTKSNTINGESSAGPQLTDIRKESSHQASWSLTLNSKALLTQETAQYANNSSIAAVDSNISGNLKILQPSGLETMSSFTVNLHQTLRPTFQLQSPVSYAQGGRRAIPGSPSFAGSNVYENLKISQRLADFQGNSSTSQPPTSMMTKGRPPMAQDKHGLKRKHFNAFTHPTFSNRSGKASPTVEKSQGAQGGTEPAVVTDSLSTKTSFSHQKHQGYIAKPEGPVPHGYMKMWEGNITSNEQGQIVVVNRLVAYKKESASEMFSLSTNTKYTVPKASVEASESARANKVVTLLPSLTSSSSPNCNFPAIFNFGDSNSDTGGLLEVPFSMPQPDAIVMGVSL